MMAYTGSKQRVLSVFSLVMINIIAVDNLRSLPISAEYGFSLIFYYLLGAVLFMLPSSLVAAELATGWPNTGGAYVWIREAFGGRIALLAIWLQWIYNVVWYPTMLSFLAGVFAYLIDPALSDNKIYMVAVITSLFWIATLINVFNMKTSSIMSTLGALVGTIIPLIVIIILGITWVMLGNPSKIVFSWESFFPHVDSLKNLGFLSAILFGLMGMEMSAVHAEDVINPRRDYPRALLYSVIIILTSLISASLAVAIVIPHAEINLVTGLINTFNTMFSNFHLQWMLPLIAFTIVIGGLGSISTWSIGPTKGLLVASQDGSLPPLLKKTNKNGMPIAILITQAIIVTILSTVFLFMPNVTSSYWLLSAMTAQLALLYYVFLFAASIKLRVHFPKVPRTFKIPGGLFGICIVSGVGLITSITVILFGFLPPTDVKVGNIYVFEGLLIFGLVICCVIPLVIYQVRKAHW